MSDLTTVTLLSYLQILSGMYPISQVQEPYTAVGYLAARVPLVDLLQLVHPLNRADSDDEDLNHPWSAWDVCDGKIKPQQTSVSSACFLFSVNGVITYYRATSTGEKPGGGGYSQKNWVGVCGPLPKTLTLFMTKICDFPYPIYDLTKNLIPYL